MARASTLGKQFHRLLRGCVDSGAFQEFEGSMLGVGSYPGARMRWKTHTVSEQLALPSSRSDQRDSSPGMTKQERNETKWLTCPSNNWATTGLLKAEGEGFSQGLFL